MPGRPQAAHPRPHNWPDLLAEFLEARRTVPFAWGTQDCATFAGDGVLTLTGTDPMAELRGAWTTEEEANAVTGVAGGLEAMLAAQMATAGMPECDPRFAQRGDVVLVEVGNQILVGLLAGTSVAVTGIDRLQFVPRRLIRRAWVV